MSPITVDGLEEHFEQVGRRFARRAGRGLDELNDYLNEAGAGDEYLMAIVMRAYIDELVQLRRVKGIRW